MVLKTTRAVHHATKRHDLFKVCAWSWCTPCYARACARVICRNDPRLTWCTKCIKWERGSYGRCLEDCARQRSGDLRGGFHMHFVHVEGSTEVSSRVLAPTSWGARGSVGAHGPSGPPRSGGQSTREDLRCPEYRQIFRKNSSKTTFLSYFLRKMGSYTGFWYQIPLKFIKN